MCTTVHALSTTNVHALRKKFRTIPCMNEPGRLITEAREAAGLNKRELAELVNLSPSMISKLESGKVSVTPDVFRSLTTALRTLRPYELVNAMGYQVTVPNSDKLPHELVRELLVMTEQEMEWLIGLVLRRPSRGIPTERPPQ